LARSVHGLITVPLGTMEWHGIRKGLGFQQFFTVPLGTTTPHPTPEEG
jgi:hypothetical protein